MSTRSARSRSLSTFAQMWDMLGHHHGSGSCHPRVPYVPRRCYLYSKHRGRCWSFGLSIEEKKGKKRKEAIIGPGTVCALALAQHSTVWWLNPRALMRPELATALTLESAYNHSQTRRRDPLSQQMSSAGQPESTRASPS